MSKRECLQPEPFRVDVRESAGSGRIGWHNCIIGQHVRFDVDGLQSYCFAAARPVVYDLILVAAVVEVCDKSRRRPAHGWHRSFSVEIPVHERARWQDKTVSDALHDALELLTGDSWDISFRDRDAPAELPEPSLLPLTVPVGAVMPYSDGLDSRAVAAIVRKKVDGELVRVRLGPVNDPASPQRRKQFAKVPYRVSALDRSAESSGRSRAFKFTALAGLAADLSGTGRVIMAESLQGALGPTLVPVAHAYEDYRNHPLFTERMESFLAALLGRRFTFDFPRLFHTKAETIREAMIIGGEFNWRDTRSCWQQSRQVSLDGTRRQCGICAACMLRRMSLHGTGHKDPPGTFIWDDLSADSFPAAVLTGFDPVKITRAQREYAIAGALHMDHLAGLVGDGRHAAEIDHAAYRIARPLGLAESEAASRVANVLRQHHAEWMAFRGSLGTRSFVNRWIDGDLP